MTTARRLHYTYEEYLAALENSGVKLEYCDGEIYAMAGGTPAHADLAASIIQLLGAGLAGRGRVSTSDLKVRIEPRSYRPSRMSPWSAASGSSRRSIETR